MPPAPFDHDRGGPSRGEWSAGELSSTSSASSGFIVEEVRAVRETIDDVRQGIDAVREAIDDEVGRVSKTSPSE